MWLAEQVELLASSIYPPRSPAVASQATVTMLTTLCFLLPRADQQPPKKERTSNLLGVLVFLSAADTRKSEATVDEDRQVDLPSPHASSCRDNLFVQ